MDLKDANKMYVIEAGGVVSTTPQKVSVFICCSTPGAIPYSLFGF